MRRLPSRSIRPAAPLAFLAAAALLAACGAVAQPAVIDPAIGGMGMGCEQSETFLFSGETSLAAIGLGDEFGGPDAQRTGMVWVTAEPVNMFGPGPPPPGAEAEAQRMVCVQWPDGSGMAMPLPPDWEPPAAFSLEGTATAGEPPLALIGLLVAVAVIAGVSFVAFRSDSG